MATVKYTRIKIYMRRENGSLEFSQFYLAGELADLRLDTYEEEEEAK